MFNKNKGSSSKTFDSLNEHTCCKSVDDFPNIKFESNVNCITFIKSGICLSGNNESAVIYNFYNGKIVKRYPNQKPITRIAYAQEKKLILYATRNKTIKIHKENEEEPLQTIEGHQLQITGLDINPANNICCSGSRDNFIKTWDVETGKQLNARFKSGNLITHLKWFPNSNLVLQASEDKTIRVWDSRNLEVCGTSPEKKHIQTYCNINPKNDNYVLSCSSGTNGDGCEITLWDIRNMKIVNEYLGHDERINAATFLSTLTNSVDTCSSQIVSVSCDLTIKLWDQITKECKTDMPVVNATALNDLVDFEDDSIGIATNQNGIQRFMRGQTYDGKHILRLISTF